MQGRKGREGKASEARQPDGSVAASRQVHLGRRHECGVGEEEGEGSEAQRRHGHAAHRRRKTIAL